MRHLPLHRHTPCPTRLRMGQAGLTLIELMVSITIGMLMVAALATLIANQSSTRAEIDKSGKMIENGRYAIQTVANDLQMAGYWGELSTAPPTPGALPDPCDVTIASLTAAMGLHVQGYNYDTAADTVPPASTLEACVKNHQPGTDVLVVRRVDPDMSAVETAGNIDLTKTTTGQVYLQTGMDSATGTSLSAVLGAGADAATNATTFSLKKKNKTSVANLRKFVVHIYYISKCSVEVAGSCTGADNGSPIPTLKRVELSVSGGVPDWSKATIAEGIENLQVDYGVDSLPAAPAQDGAADGADVKASALAFGTWPDAMTAKVHLLARSTEKTAGFQDTKSYVLGTNVVAATNDGYHRHVFVQSVRLVNPSSRRAL
jgi:type IV pilus assembly protein PilW